MTPSVLLYLRALVFYTGVMTTLCVFAPLALFIRPLPYRTRYRLIIQTWAHLNIRWLETTCRLGFRVTGTEHLPDGPAIIFCKHQSAWETFALQEVFPPYVWVLKREVLWLPLFGWGLATLDPIAIDRKAGTAALRQIVRTGSARLESGLGVIIFPEGTRVRLGERRRYEPGGGMLAARSGFPVVPVAHNAGLFWPRQSWIKYPGTIDVVIGPVIDPAGKSATEITVIAEDWIEATCERLAASPARA